MGLSHDLISQFVKVTNDRQTAKKETIAYGTAVELDGKKYVRLDGSEMLTPVSSTADAEANERVTVLIKDHTATITGNASSPAARKQSVDDAVDQITEVEILVANKVSTEDLDAERGRINTLVSENVTIKERLTASEANIDNLEANTVSTAELNAQKARIDSLEANTLTVDAADVKYATIESLEATDADFRNLKSDYGTFKTATADNFEAVNASINNLDATYANIDFANIGEAAVEKFYAASGIIQNLTLETGVVVKELIGVLISGDLIKGNTIQADKLIVRGEDGLYYKLNVDALGETTASADPKYQNGLDGSVIVAKSVTAEKVAVDDLVAFGATIGGFNIAKDSIYSGVKSSINNTTEGIYLDKSGQIAFGDSSNFIKYYKDQNGDHKLEISADSILFGSSKKSVETSITQNSQQISLRATSETVSSEIASANSKISDLKSQLDIQQKSISSFVRNGDNASLIKQESNGVCYLDVSAFKDIITKENTDAINSANDDISKLLKDTEYLKTKTAYISAGVDKENNEPYIELGEGKSGLKLRITNEKIEFKEGDYTPAYITNEKLMIEKAEVENELRFGNFVWKERGNHNMGLIWEEETS